MKTTHIIHLGFLVTLMVACLAQANASQAQVSSPLLGDWRAPDGAAVARVAPCVTGPGLCATVIDERPAPGDAPTLGQVMVRNLQPAQGGWRGTYGSPDQNLSTRVRLINPDTIDLRVCANIILCESARYTRVRR